MNRRQGRDRRRIIKCSVTITPEFRWRLSATTGFVESFPKCGGTVTASPLERILPKAIFLKGESHANTSRYELFIAAGRRPRICSGYALEGKGSATCTGGELDRLVCWAERWRHLVEHRW